jgi:hypothetical protein
MPIYLSSTSKSFVMTAGMLFLCGCSVYRVKVWHDENDVKPDGIPFYTTKPVCEQKTTYLQPIYTVVVTKPSSDTGKPPTIVLTRNIDLHQRVSHSSDAAHPACGDQLTRLLSGKVPTDLKENSLLDQCSEAEPPLPSSFPSDNDRLLAGNTASFTSIIDAQHRYSFNVKRPIAGSSTGDISLAPDGTLQKATATVNDQTLQTLASTLTAVTGAATQIAKGVAFAPIQIGYYGASLSTTTYIWTAAHYLPSAKSVADCKPGPLVQLDQNARTTRQLETTPDSAKPQDISQQKKQ